MTGEADARVADLLRQAFKRCKKKSRAQIALEMTERLGCPVTEFMLNDFTKRKPPGGVNRFRAAWVPAFCEITGDDEFAKVFLTERLQSVLAIGELCVSSCGTLEQALVEIKKLQTKAREARRT